MNNLNNIEEDEEVVLISEIEEEMRKIHVIVESLYNNLSLNEPNDPLEKCLISNHCYSNALLGRGINDIDENTNPLKRLEGSLQKEIDFLCGDLDKMTRKMNEYKEVFDSIDRNIDNLHTMIEATERAVTSTKSTDDITRHLKMRFRKEKSDLKAIISGLFPDNLDIQDLIARIIEHHLSEGSDKYLQLEESDDITEQIETLRRTQLFDINPHDPLQIRLAELL